MELETGQTLDSPSSGLCRLPGQAHALKKHGHRFSCLSSAEARIIGITVQLDLISFSFILYPNS